ncbi:MAG TPA: hypothetical protein PKD78_07970 [Saprospiraceae bacterium]|nr:hypothetical protein [Saprospiraceae bacterium]
MKQYFLSLCLLFAGLTASAQLASDALRYSVLRPSGTARFLGAGGAFGALGADFGSISQNPAGLAMYRSNELVVTPAIRFARSETGIPGTGNERFDDDDSAFGFDNFGMVFNTSPTNKRWKTFNVAIGVNRQSNYRQALYYEGAAPGSIINMFYDNAKPLATKYVTNPDDQKQLDLLADNLYPFAEGLAWNATALYYQDGVFTSDFQGNRDTLVTRSHKVSTRGKMDEMVLAFAGNYDERLMVGATVGVPFVSYTLEGEYVERDDAGLVKYFDNLTYTDYLKTTGIGINLKLGLQYKVNQALRLGAAFHTPTRLGLTDKSSTSLIYAYTNNSGPNVSDEKRSPEGTSDYRLTTPWRAIGSAAVVLKKYGFVSADVEWVDYGTSAFKFGGSGATTADEASERQENATIEREYGSALNMRFGGEAVLGKFRLRAGVNLQGKPAKTEDGFNVAYTAGGGVRADAFYLDLGWRRYTGNGSAQPYVGAPLASSTNSSNDLILTLGFKF